MKEREEGRYIAVLLSTVLEKGGDGTLVVVAGRAGCLGLYTPERHTRQRHFLYTASFSLSSFLFVPLHAVLCLSHPFSYFALDIPEEKIMRYKVGVLIRSLARSLLFACPVVNSFDAC